LSLVDAQLDRKYGAPPEKAVAGVSFGGMLAIVAAAGVPAIKRYVALSPVTKLSSLEEYKFQSNDFCSPLVLKPNKPGFITYSKDDARVDAHLIAEAVPSLGASSSVTDGFGHSTSPDQLRDARRHLP
jgi:pimeloyl-ACP methyl ester carboxylesterase